MQVLSPELRVQNRTLKLLKRQGRVALYSLWGPKNVVPSVSNLYDYWGGKRLSQLLALFVALAVTPPMLLAQEWDHLIE
jgi:hypothetical protein